MNHIAEITQRVIEDFKHSLQGKIDDIFCDLTLYIAIDAEDNVKVSMCSNIMDEAYEGIVILVHDVVAYTNSYWWYKVYYIKNNGEVIQNYQYKNFSITSNCPGKYIDQYVTLFYDKVSIYSFLINHSTWVDEFKKLWEAFKIAKRFKTPDEIRLSVALYHDGIIFKESTEKNNELQEREKLLEYHIKEYRDILGQLKGLLNDYNIPKKIE